MMSRVEKEILRNKVRNEIFYSLPRYELNSIRHKIAAVNHSEYIDVLIEFKADEIDRIFKLLSTTYVLPNKESIDGSIWETYICNKILFGLQAKGMEHSSELIHEKEILMSFKLDKYLDYFPNRTTVETVNEVSKVEKAKRVRIHYLPDEGMATIDFQKAINYIFSKSIFFNNMLYTSANSFRSYYKYDGKWIKEIGENHELWHTNTKSVDQL